MALSCGLLRGVSHGLVWDVKRSRGTRSGHLVLEELQRRALAACAALLLDGAQLDAADLAGHGLRQRRELEAPDAFVRRQRVPREGEDLARELTARLIAVGHDDHR